MIAWDDLFTINKYGNDLDEDIFCFGLFRMGYNEEVGHHDIYEMCVDVFKIFPVDIIG